MGRPHSQHHKVCGYLHFYPKHAATTVHAFSEEGRALAQKIYNLHKIHMREKK